jgi:integrase
MPKPAKALPAITVSRLKNEGLHFVGVTGLYLQVGKNPAHRSWILNVTTSTGRRRLGLGAYPAVSLVDATLAASAMRRELVTGTDPTAVKQAAATEKKAKKAAAADLKKANKNTFDTCAAQYIKAKRHGWKNAKHAAQWTTTLKTYASPFIGQLPVKDITRAHVLAALQPIWITKTETASRVRGRIEAVLDYAKSLDLRTGDNPAAWAGGLESILAAPRKVATEKNHAALDYERMGAFMAGLRTELCILTATRSNEARAAKWCDIDLDNAVWTIPAAGMKKGKAHTVALSTQAIDLLRTVPRFAGVEYVFATREDGYASETTLRQLLTRLDYWVTTEGELRRITTHGFRAAFRTWAEETTDTPRAVVEFALAHGLKDRTEAAYQRSNLLEKRRPLMQLWANHCDNDNPPNSFDNV